jgi:class 3 adenylate cyclase
MENIRTAMNRGAFDFLTKPVNFTDLELTMEKTISHVQQIHETIKAIKENNIVRMYVDDTVLNFMNTKEFENSLMVNETIDATVAFIDICGFTAFSEKESPNAVVELLNSYFDVIVKEVIAQNGLIDKFFGGATMAVFKGDYHLDRAIDACLAVRKQISDLPNRSNGISYSPEVSIGINSGAMISGNTGSAALRRLDFTVIGDEVNTAHRLQDVAKEGQILITKDRYDTIKESFKCNKVGLVNLKNKSKPVIVYEVIE